MSEEGNVNKEEVDDINGKLAEFQESFQSEESDDCVRDTKHFIDTIRKMEDQMKEFSNSMKLLPKTYA